MDFPLIFSGREGFQRASDKPFGRARRHGTKIKTPAVRGRTDAIRGTTPVDMPCGTSSLALNAGIRPAPRRKLPGGLRFGSCRRACTLPGSLLQACPMRSFRIIAFHIGEHYIEFSRVCQALMQPFCSSGEPDEVQKFRAARLLAPPCIKRGWGWSVDYGYSCEMNTAWLPSASLIFSRVASAFSMMA